jgi:myo-inositol-1-phosphate synthase
MRFDNPATHRSSSASQGLSRCVTTHQPKATARIDGSDGSEEDPPADGKLAVLMPGLGAVATTTIAGVMLARKGLGTPIGSLTQMGRIRLGKRTSGTNPLIQEFVPISPLKDLAFGGWDVFPDDAYEAAAHADVLQKQHLDQVKDELSAIKPMKAVFYPEYVKRLHGTEREDPVDQGRHGRGAPADIKGFIKDNGCYARRRRLVRLDRGVHSAGRGPRSDQVVRGGAREERPADHQLPDVRVGLPQGRRPLRQRLAELRGRLPRRSGSSRSERQVAIAGKDFKTGQTLMKTVIAPALKARMLGLRGWYSTNILGNRDGEILDDPESFKTKERPSSASSTRSSRPSPQGALRRLLPQGPHRLLPAPRRRRRRAGTTSISSGGSATRCR